MQLECAQRHRTSYPVASGSSAKTYPVSMFIDGQLPTCLCTGFMTKRNKLANQIGGGFAGAGTGLAHSTAAWCKHLEEVKNTTCSWEGRVGEKQMVCPQCGGPVVDKTAPRLPAGRGTVSFAGVKTPSFSASRPLPSKAPVRKAPAPRAKKVDPKELLDIVRDLSDETPAPVPSAASNQGISTFERITGKKSRQSTDSASQSTDAASAAAQLAALLERA